MTGRPALTTLTTAIAHGRAWRRLILLATVTVGYYSYAVIATGLRPDAIARVHRRLALFQGWCRASVRVLGLRVETRGTLPQGGPAPSPSRDAAPRASGSPAQTPEAPAPNRRGQQPAGALVLSNHLSYFDVIVLGAAAPMAFVAKSEVARWPAIGFLSRFVETIFVDRSSRSALPQTTHALAQLLAEGVRIVIFPEGTTTNGDLVLPFRGALLQPFVEARANVVCAALHYETPAGSPPPNDAVCWWGDAELSGHVYRALMLPSITAHVAWSDRPLVAANRKALAVTARDQVVAQVEALRGSPLPGVMPGEPLPVGAAMFDAAIAATSAGRADDERREAGNVDGFDRQRLQAGGVE